MFGAEEAFAGMCAATGMSAEHIETAFELSVYDPAAPAAIGPLGLRFQPVPHFVPGETFAAPTSKVRRFLEQHGWSKLVQRPAPEGGSSQTAQR